MNANEVCTWLLMSLCWIIEPAISLFSSSCERYSKTFVFFSSKFAESVNICLIAKIIQPDLLFPIRVLFSCNRQTWNFNNICIILGFFSLKFANCNLINEIHKCWLWSVLPKGHIDVSILLNERIARINSETHAPEKIIKSLLQQWINDEANKLYLSFTAQGHNSDT